MPEQRTQSWTDAGKGSGAIVIVGQTGQNAGEEGRICAGEGLSTNQFGNEQRMVDSDQSCPFSLRRQLRRQGEIAEFLQDLDALLEPMPETGAQGLNGFGMPLLFLPEA